MNTIIAVLTDNILPIFIVAAFGFALRRWLGLDKRVLSNAVFNCLSPCLVFSSLVNSQLAGDELINLALFTILTILSMAFIGLTLARLLKLPRTDTVALLLVLMFVNGGNYGLTLSELRYGEAGLSRAIVYFVTSTFITYTAGILIASMGKMTWQQAIRRLIRLPAFHAAIWALIVYNFQITVPGPLMKGIDVAGAGAIPVLLLVLGMQIADLQIEKISRLTLPAVLARLLIGPLVGIGMALLLDLDGLTHAISIIQSSMPPAVFTIILATEFDVQPTAVTSTVVLATLLSPITIAIVISLFGL